MPKEKPSTAVATQGTQALERPSFIKQGDVRGSEHMTQADLQIPRIAIAQALSPQLNAADPKYIEDLKQGQMFNNLTGEVLGAGPIEVVVVKADPPRGIEFFPRDEGGGVKDPNVPIHDPRMEFGPNGERPVATKFYDFVVIPVPLAEGKEPMESIIALSMKGSQLKVARQLNSLIKLRNAPLFACRYVLVTQLEKNKHGTYFNFRVTLAGYCDEPTYRMAEDVFGKIKERKLDIDREPGSDVDPDAPGAESEI